MDTKAIAGLLAALGLAAVACGSDGEAEAPRAASLSIESPEDGTTILGNVARLDVEATGIEIVPPDGDTSGDTGHFHVFIDRDPAAAGQVIPKEQDIIHSTDDPITISGLTVGDHRFVVVFGDGEHKRIGSTQAEIDVTVEGPSVTATAVTEGATVTVTAVVDGVEIVIDPPSAEHLHYLLDTEPVFGEPIPTENPAIIHSRETSAVFESVAPGDHTIYVVLADGEHVPADPPVFAKLAVTLA